MGRRGAKEASGGLVVSNTNGKGGDGRRWKGNAQIRITRPIDTFARDRVKTKSMRIISTKKLIEYYTKHPDCKSAIIYWIEIVKRAKWRNAADVKVDFANVDSIGGQRYVFNIGGNRHRLVTVVQFVHLHVYIRFIGTHAEYDRIDCRNI